MPISQAEYIAMLQRTQKPSRDHLFTGDGVERESKLHDQIIAHCNSRWPRWKYIHARMDKRSTVAVGSQDFTIFLPNGRTVCIECKKKGEKPDADQLAWHKEMEMLGHVVHVVYSEEQFFEVVK